MNLNQSQLIAFEVFGNPKGQPRPKAFARKFGNGQVMARVYTPGTAEEWKSQIAVAAKEFIPFIPLKGPIRVDIEFRFSRPKSHYLTRGIRPDAPFWHTSKPDRDNCEKAVLDALTILGMWDDDAQVCCGEVRKVYNDNPGAQIMITPLVNQEQEKPNGKQKVMAF